MKSGLLEVDFSTPMPAKTGRYHPKSYKVSNAKAAIDACARQPIGSDKIRCMDTDVQVVWMTVSGERIRVAICAHWDILGKEGWIYAVVNGRRRALTKTELKYTHQQWIDRNGGNKAALQMLRRPNGDKPLTWWDAVAYAKTKGVVLTPELKDVRFAIPEVAERLVDTCRKMNYPCWAMALLAMSNPAGKCKAIIEAGGQFAMIFGNWAYWSLGKSRIKDWPVRPTQNWGPVRADRWIKEWELAA